MRRGLRSANLEPRTALTLAVPAGASVIDPDHELLELGRQRAALLKDEAAADADLDAAVDKFWKVAPPEPEALHTRLSDYDAIGVQHKPGRVVGAENIDTLRRHLGYNEAPFKSLGINKAFYLRCVEVIEAFDEWYARIETLEASFGIPEKIEASNTFTNAIMAIERRIAKQRASTIAGLRLKAEIARRHEVGGDHAIIGSILDDLAGDA